MVERVVATPAALELIARLQHEHGELLFYQSGGCCEGSAPLCMLPHELSIGPSDVHLGAIGGVPFYISPSQFAYWQHTQLIIDAVVGDTGTFSLEGPTGMAFLTRSRLFTDAEWAELSAPTR